MTIPISHLQRGSSLVVKVWRVGAKAMDRRREEWKEHLDAPTSLISHTWRGSLLTVKRAGWEDGRKGERRKG